MKIFLTFFLFFFTLSYHSLAWTCACCTNGGEWSSRTAEYSSSGFFELIFKERYLDANIDAAGEAGVCSLLEKEKSFSVGVTDKSLVLISKKNKKNQIYFIIPKKLEYRSIDTEKFTSPHSKKKWMDGPILYHELVARGKVILKGELSKTGKTIEGILVYQGAGGGCFDYNTTLQEWFLEFNVENDSPCLFRSKLKSFNSP